MKELYFIEGVVSLKLIGGFFHYIDFKTRELYYINSDFKSIKIINNKIDNYITQSNTIVYQSENAIYRLKNNSAYKIIKENEENYLGLQNYLFDNKTVISLTRKGDWLANSMLLLSNNDEIEKLDFIFNAEIFIDNYYYSHNSQSVFAYTKLHQEIWRVDVKNYGRDIAKDPKTGEILWDKPNEIKEELLADDKNIYVPLKGGQLLALDAETGKKVWMWEQPRNGTFAIQGKYIYKQDGLTVFEIDTKTGKLIKKKNFNDDVLVDKFHASGPLWVYEDVIIVCDVLYGKICLLNRNTLKVEEFFSLNKNLVNSKSAIRWHDNKLYVLDIDYTLHIFEKTPKLPTI